MKEELIKDAAMGTFLMSIQMLHAIHALVMAQMTYATVIIR